MTNTDPGAPEYEYEWQNPNRKTFDFGRTFSRSMDILKLRGKKMLIVSSVLLGIPFMLINMWPLLMSGGLQEFIETEDPSALLGGGSVIIIALALIGGLLLLIATFWLQPALIKMSYSALTKEDERIMPTLKQVSRFVLPMIGFYILYIFAVMIGFVLLIIPALFIGLGWMLAGHIIVLEEQGVMDSIGRSWNITKGYKRWLLLLSIVFGIIGMIIGIVVSIPIYFMADPNLALLEGASPFYWIVNGVLSSIGQVLGTVLGVAWSTSAYVEIRKIREGVDPESQVDVFT